MTELRLIKVSTWATNSGVLRHECYVSSKLDVWYYVSPGKLWPWPKWSAVDYRSDKINDNIDASRSHALNIARRGALLKNGGEWCAYQDGGAAEIVSLGLRDCLPSDLFSAIADYLVAHVPFSLPSPANDVHLCVAREFDFTHLTTDLTTEIIAECRRGHDRWHDPWRGRSRADHNAEIYNELWKIAGRSDVTFEFDGHKWLMTDNDTTHTTKCSVLHSLVLSLRRSQIVCKMWNDVDLPDKSEAEYEAFKQCLGL